MSWSRLLVWSFLPLLVAIGFFRGGVVDGPTALP
jgi:hypothetical protein